MSTVFYSWQSDLPETRNVIEKALDKAIRNMNRDLTVETPLRLDQDTQGVAGWPEITTALLDKIDRCEVFVADITPINGPTSAFRITPNPNVLLELGYAVGTGLGRTRIICVINTHYLPNGDLRELPFDLRGSRPVQFTLEDPTRRGAKAGQADPIRIRARTDLAGKLRMSLAEVIHALQERRSASEENTTKDNLTPESRLVVKEMIEQIDSRGSDPYHVGRDVLKAIRDESGMQEHELVKELTRLDREGYIEFDQRQGCRLYPRGIVLGYMHANYQEFETTYREIAAYVYKTVVEGNQISVGDILERTGHPSILVDSVLDLWASQDLIKMVRTMGGTDSDTVWHVSPLLEEEVSA